MVSQAVYGCSTSALTGASRPSDICGLAFDDETPMRVVAGNQLTTSTRLM